MPEQDISPLSASSLPYPDPLGWLATFVDSQPTESAPKKVPNMNDYSIHYDLTPNEFQLARPTGDDVLTVHSGDFYFVGGGQGDAFRAVIQAIDSKRCAIISKSPLAWTPASPLSKQDWIKEEGKAGFKYLVLDAMELQQCHRGDLILFWGISEFGDWFLHLEHGDNILLITKPGTCDVPEVEAKSPFKSLAANADGSDPHSPESGEAASSISLSALTLLS